MAKDAKLNPKLSKLIKRISTKIVSLRHKKDWSQEEAAEHLNCDLRWYQRLESGRHIFSLETIVRLASLHNIDEDELLKK